MMKVKVNALLEKKEKQLAKLCQEIYELAVEGRTMIPRHPYVLVRVLPKEHKTEGGIWLADNAQNKPVYEGIVLSVWEPYQEERRVYDKDGERIGTTFIDHKCELEVGDRVAFPHYEGVSMQGYLDDKYYRLIREGSDQNQYPYMSVLGKLHYHGDVDIAKKIRKLTALAASITTSGFPVARGSNPT